MQSINFFNSRGWLFCLGILVGILGVGPNAIAQETEFQSVEQLRDVQPTDWAFEALSNLNMNYGCLAGYPSETFLGNRSLSRWEFAAGLNACLNALESLLQQSHGVLEADLETLQRLTSEFQGELAALNSRVDNLEGRVSFLEDHQFSTTTKLHGSAIFSLADVFGGDGTNQTVFQQRVNLSLISSFTGKDLLLIGLFAGNVPIQQFEGDNLAIAGSAFDIAGINFPIPGTDKSVTVGTAEGTLSSQFGANTNNNVKALALAYSFPVTKSVNVVLLSSLSTFQIYAPTLNPHFDDFEGGTGAISLFGEYNPIYALVGGGTGLIVNYQITENLKFTGGYLADGLIAGNPQEGQGLFNGGYGALGQITWNVTERFAVAGVYINEYSNPGRFGFNYNGLGVAGTAVANTLAGQDLLLQDRLGLDTSAVITNGYGIQFSWQPSADFALNGWFSTFYPRLIGRGDGNILTYALTFAFPNLGKEGNLLGFVVGAEPYLSGFSGGDPQPFDVDVPWHLEVFYRYQLNDNISITPGVIWLTAPNQSNDNPDAFVATVRTTFRF